MSAQTPNRVMVIVAHPDDPEYFCGGTIALWCEAGSDVCYLILTDGNKGSADPEMTHEKLTTIRKQEQQAAADLLGVKEIRYLNEPDGELQPTLELRKRVVTEIRRYRPDTVIAFDPTRYFYENARINHADHRAAGEVALDAIFPAAGNRMYHPELLEQGLEPHEISTLYLIASENPNLWIDISEVFETKKVAAIRAHASQVRDPDNLTQRLKKRHGALDQYDREVLREEFRVLRLR